MAGRSDAILWSCPSGGTGRRRRLKIFRPPGLGGSSPSSGTIPFFRFRLLENLRDKLHSRASGGVLGNRTVQEIGCRCVQAGRAACNSPPPARERLPESFCRTSVLGGPRPCLDEVRANGSTCGTGLCCSFLPRNPPDWSRPLVSDRRALALALLCTRICKKAARTTGGWKGRFQALDAQSVSEFGGPARSAIA
jgi:hypothetical protein